GIHADAILIYISKIARGQDIGVPPDAIFWIVREEGSTWQVRIGLRDEGVTVVGTGRITGLRDSNAVPVLRTDGGELAEQPAIRQLVVNYNRVTGIVCAVRDREVCPDRAKGERAQQPVALFIINGPCQVHHLDIMIGTYVTDRVG